LTELWILVLTRFLYTHRYPLRSKTLASYFDAFSLREPVPTSLENAVEVARSVAEPNAGRHKSSGRKVRTLNFSSQSEGGFLQSKAEHRQRLGKPLELFVIQIAENIVFQTFLPGR